MINTKTITMDHWIDSNRNDRLMPCQTSTEESTSTESTKNHIYKRCRRRRTASIIPCATNLSKKLQSSPFTSFHLTLFAFALISTTITIISTNANGFDAAKKEWSNGAHHHHHHSSHQSSSSSSSSSSAVASSNAIASAPGSPRPRYRTLYACEGSSLEIACEPGTHINLIRANFGRFSISICNEHGNVEWSVDCMSHRSLRVIQERCSGRSHCNLEASIATFGEDACPRVHKYLEVHFNCTAPRTMSNNVAVPLNPVISSPALTPQVNSADNHSQYHHNPHHVNENGAHNPLVTLSPVVLFPEPPSGNDHNNNNNHHHQVSTSTVVSPPRVDLDFTPFNTKEEDETPEYKPNIGPMVGNGNSRFQDSVIEISPPRPKDYLDPIVSNEDSDDLDDSDDTDSEPKVSTNNEPVYNSNQNQISKPSFPVVVGQPSVEPTAKPPKPQYEVEMPSSEEGRQSFQSPSIHSISLPQQPPSIHNNNVDESLIDEQNVEVYVDRIYDHCQPMYAKGLNWNYTMAGRVAMQSCPDGADGIARWSCIMDGTAPTWTPHLPDMSNCSSLWVTHLVARIHSHRESVLSLAEELAKGAKGKKMYSGDLIRAADIVKQLVVRLETLLEESKDDDQERRAHVIKELLNSVLNVASNLLEDIQIESWHELSPQDQRLSIGSMTGALESVAQMLADVLSQPNYNYVRTHNNILVSVHVHSLSALENGMHLPLVLSQHESITSMTDSASSEVSAHLPYEALVEHANDNGQVKVVFMMYRQLASLLKPRWPASVAYESVNGGIQASQPYAYQHYQPPPMPQNEQYDSYGSRTNPNNHHQYHRMQPFQQHQSIGNTIVNSDVIGLIIASDMHRSSYDRLSTPLSAPLELTLRHLQTDNVTNGRCAFWDIKRSDWSTAGCETITTNRTHTTCRCNHLTNFAILMDVTNVPMNSYDQYGPKLIIRIGCIISIVALTLCLFTLSVYRSLKSVRNSIHKHLCACLLVAEVIFLFGIDETRIKLICGLIAIALHYFFLAAFLWMFFEALQLYTMQVQVFEAEKPNRLTFYTLIAYGAPALLVIVAALVDPLSYGTINYCWLRSDNHFVWSFLGPALAVLLAATLFLTLAMGVVCRNQSSPSSSGMIGSTTFSVHQKQPQQLKVYPSPLTSSPSYSYSEHLKNRSIKIWLRTSFILTILLGLTWTFAVLYLSNSAIHNAYIFTSLNSLQGILIFILCCLLDKSVLAEYRSSLSRGARRCFLLRPFEPSSLAFATKSSTDSTRSTSIRDSHHLMMAGGGVGGGNSPHHLSQQHLYMQQPAASFLGSRNVGPRTSLLYLNELLGKSETPTASTTPTADQPLITASHMLQQSSLANNNHQQTNLSHAQSQLALDQSHLTALQQTQLSQALSSLNQIQLPDDASSSDYGCRRLTQMIEHIYECIDEDPYVAKLLLPAIERSLNNHQARVNMSRLVGQQTVSNGIDSQQQQQQQQQQQSQQRHSQLSASLLATLGRSSNRDISQQMRLQANSSYLPSGNGHHTLHGALSSLHLPAIVRDNTANGKIANSNGQLNGAFQHSGQMMNSPQTQQHTIAMLDGDQVRCCTLNDHKLCDHQSEMNNGTAMSNHHMMNMKMNGTRHHLASEC